MNIKLALTACSVLLRRQGKIAIIEVSNVKVKCSDVKDTIDKLTKWCYPELSSEHMELLIHCKNCVHYKRYRKKGAGLKGSKMLCDIDKSAKEGTFYCGYAIERSDKNE